MKVRGDWSRDVSTPLFLMLVMAASTEEGICSGGEQLMDVEFSNVETGEFSGVCLKGDRDVVFVILGICIASSDLIAPSLLLSIALKRGIFFRTGKIRFLIV